MSDNNSKNRELKQAFIQHLPERIAALEGSWQKLLANPWEQTGAEQIYGRIQELAGSSGKYGLIELNEALFSLEIYLSSFVGSQLAPDDSQKQQLEQMVQRVRLIADRAAGADRNDAGAGNKMCYFLRRTDQSIPGLAQSLQRRGFRLLTFSDAEDLEGEITKTLPDLMIFEGYYLQGLSSLKRELTLQLEQQNRQLPIFCLNDNRNLEQRLLAMRAGVSQYFLAPFKIEEIADQALKAARPQEKQHRVLLVEDDQAQAQFATRILEKGGMKALAVTEPLQVFDALASFRPDLILMDLYMPHANGMELTTLIREHPDFVTTPIVFLSGEQDTDKKLNALSYGGDDFLSKPILPKHLISTISNRIQRAQTLGSHQRQESGRDRITGLFNRRYFYEQLDGIIAEMPRQAPRGGLLHLDIINMSDINSLGDSSQQNRLLTDLARVITDQLEPQDVACRLSDHSFTIIASRPQARHLEQLAQQLYETISGHDFSLGETQVTLEPAIGIVPFSARFEDAASMVSLAQRASDQASEQQASAIVDATTLELPEQQVEELPLAQLLRNAIDDGGLQIMFLPLSDRQKRNECYEMIPRLLGAKGAAVEREQWRAVALTERLLGRIDRWLTDKALGNLEERRAEGKQIELYLELSMQSLMDPEFTDWLKQQLRQRQLVGTGITLEFRIAELGSDLRGAKEQISQLQEMGLGVGLSRFGANSAAFRVLQYLKPSHVRFARPILNAEPELAKRIIGEVRNHDCRILLPRVANPHAIAQHWLNGADLIPGQLGSQGR